MLKKTCFGAVLPAAAAVSTTAMAQDRGVNTAVGALAGAAIGGGIGGRDGAIVGGVLGAAIGNSARTYDDGYYRGRVYSSGSYYQPAPVYVEPRPVYVESAPVYYDAPAYYYRDRPTAVYVERGRGYDRGYYDRGHYDRGHYDRGGWDHHHR